MAHLLTLTLLCFGYAVAQDADCDYTQNVGASDTYYINNNYNAGRTCRYIAICPTGYNCRVDCYLYMPLTPGCRADRLLISRVGDYQLINAEAYCGYTSVSAVSTTTTLGIGLVVPHSSRGGAFVCNLTAQAAPVTPAPTICRCGERKQNRIVGGHKTQPYEYTMMAGLIEKAIDSLHCGAVILSSQHVMTAAHCVDNFRNRPGDLTVAVGVYNISNPNSGSRHQIKKFIIHEKYDSNTYDYDIAICELTKAMIFNENVQPVCLPFKFEHNNLAGSLVTLLGWGTQSFGGPMADLLQKVDVSVIDPDRCAATEPNITPRQICTNTAGKDACQFDSGGPALYTDPATGSLFSVGVLSHGNGCGGTGSGISTRVTELLRWIVSNVAARFCIKR